MTPLQIDKRGTINSYFPPERKDWNQEVTLFTCTKWKGEPSESEEMKPEWFAFNNIPYSQMWKDDPIWLPRILNGHSVRAEFHFDWHNNTVTYRIDNLA